MRTALISALTLLASWPAAAQTPSSNAVGECTLIVDPTALRLCVESARQTRPASSFDPAGQTTGANGSTAIDLLPRPPRRGTRKALDGSGPAPVAPAGRPIIP